MTSRISVHLAEGPTVGVSVSSTSYLQDTKISRGTWVPLTEYLHQWDCNGVVNILNIHLLMNHWLTQPDILPRHVLAIVSGIDGGCVTVRRARLRFRRASISVQMRLKTSESCT